MRALAIAAALAGLTLLSFFYFPGHTWLQQDSQIYVAILEHLRDPAALRNDYLVQRPHVSFTLYDEVSLGIERVTGAPLRDVLQGEQILTRGLGLWGLYLMATAAGLAAVPALFVTAALSLGVMILGPMVLVWEYEPVPRALAVPLLYLALGLTAHRRDLAAGFAGAVAFLIHPPTVYPFWGLYFLLALRPDRPAIMRQRLYAFAPLFCATIALLVASRYQAGAGETQLFFERLAPETEKLQRFRANYNWVDVWWRVLLPQYALLFALALAGYWRVRKTCTPDLRFFLAGLPVIGMLSMPLSWLLLERLHWALIPQFQPMRAMLFITLCALFCAAVAGWWAAAERRYPEALFWLVVLYWVPANTRVLEWPPWNRVAAVAVAALIAIAAAWSWSRKFRWAPAAVAAAALVPVFLLPGLAQVRNYPDMETAALERLSAWARASTSRDAVFLFGDAGRDGAPGIFRAEAERAVYVDWKGGGQVNYLKELGEEWWTRWQATMAKPFRPADVPRYRALGVDYLVLSPAHRLTAQAPVFADSKYLVYDLSSGARP